MDKISGRVGKLEEVQVEHSASLTFYGEEISSIKSEIASIRKEARTISSDVKNSVQTMNHDKYIKSLYINGIPQDPDDQPQALVKKLATEMGIALGTGEIEDVFRVRSKTTKDAKPPTLIVKFTNITQRDAFYKARKILVSNNITSGTLGLNDNQPIYINEHLDKEQQNLFYHARQLKRDYGYKHAWTFHGVVYVRKNQDTEAVRVSSIADLEMLKQ